VPRNTGWKDKTTRTPYLPGLKSRYTGLLLYEEKRQCGAAKHRVEYLHIVNHSPKQQVKRFREEIRQRTRRQQPKNTETLKLRRPSYAFNDNIYVNVLSILH